MKSYYAIIPAEVRYDRALTANAKLLYGEITALCNERGFCWASNGYFAELYSTDKSTVSRWIKALSDNGYVELSYSYSDGANRIQGRRINLLPLEESTDEVLQVCGGLQKKQADLAKKSKEIIQANNTSSACTHRDSKSANCDLAKCAQHYRDNIGTLAPTVGGSIKLFLERGAEPDLICEAIDEAARQNKCSWSYVSAILTRCLNSGIKSAAEFKADIKPVKKRVAGWGAQPKKQSDSLIVGALKRREEKS
ncbi:MAG: helix-turn-helix domain-containing protein [Oscillospiraceae bacterium]